MVHGPEQQCEDDTMPASRSRTPDHLARRTSEVPFPRRVSGACLPVLCQVRKIRALLFHGLCRLGKIDWALESHQELDRCLSRTITASKNFND